MCTDRSVSELLMIIYLPYFQSQTRQSKVILLAEVREPFMTEILQNYADVRKNVKIPYNLLSSYQPAELNHDFFQKLVPTTTPTLAEHPCPKKQ